MAEAARTLRRVGDDEFWDMAVNGIRQPDSHPEDNRIGA
jgi:hypothetical protein